MQLSIIIPFYNGHKYIDKLISTIPSSIPVIIVDDQSFAPYQSNSKNVTYHRMERKGYFSGAVNEGIKLTKGDVLILNQDVSFEGTSWLDMLADNKQYAMIGERIGGHHPAWKNGYIQGTFMYLRRDLIDAVGLLNEVDYPLWGSTCEYQLRACRAGYKVLPVKTIPGFTHSRRHGVGDGIRNILRLEPHKKELFIRTPPEVSIIASCYNKAPYISDLVNSFIGGETCLGNYKQQSFASFELILVNDNSTDNTHEVCTQLADAWKGVRYIKRDKNGGSAVANNTGIAHSYGRYITIIGGDDMRAAGSLERLYRKQLENPHSFIYDGIIAFKAGAIRPDINVGISDYNFDKLLYRNHVHAGIMFPKVAWYETGGYPEIMNDGREDWAMNVALGKFGYCGVRIHENGYLYRREGQNRSLRNTNPSDHKRFLAKIQSLFPELYQGDRPEMCCGSKTSVNKTVVRNSKRKPLEVANMANLIILEYIGKSWGTQSYYGTFTGSQYRAGASRKEVAVDPRDFYGTPNRPGLLDLRENGKPVFRIRPKPKPVAPIVATATPTIDAVVVELNVEPESETVYPYSKFTNEEKAKEIFFADVAAATATSIKKMTLSKEEATLWLEAEKAGKARVSVIDYLEKLCA